MESPESPEMAPPTSTPNEDGNMSPVQQTPAVPEAQEVTPAVPEAQEVTPAVPEAQEVTPEAPTEAPAQVTPEAPAGTPTEALGETMGEQLAE